MHNDRTGQARGDTSELVAQPDEAVWDEVTAYQLKNQNNRPA
jgi:hypothetical protein